MLLLLCVGVVLVFMRISHRKAHGSLLFFVRAIEQSTDVLAQLQSASQPTASIQRSSSNSSSSSSSSGLSNSFRSSLTQPSARLSPSMSSSSSSSSSSLSSALISSYLARSQDKENTKPQAASSPVDLRS